MSSAFPESEEEVQAMLGRQKKEMNPDKAFVTKDSGAREAFATGSVRDTQEGKPRYGLIPVEALKRLAELYARGAVKYGKHNWRKGQPFERTYESLYRHLMQWASGERDEDHLAAVAWGAMALMTYEELIARGVLPVELDDMNIISKGKA